MIVSLGDAVVDLVARPLATLPAWGEDREVAAITRHLGGSALHVATNLAALGEAVALLAGVGRDEWGDNLVAGARTAGVETGGIARLDAPTAVTMVLSGPTDRAFVSVYGATATYAAENLDRGRLARARHVHLSGLWQSRGLWSALPPLFDELHARGATLSLDPNYDPTDRWGEPLPALLARLDCLLCNDLEAQRITGAETAAAALAVLAETVPLVVMKQGAAGAQARRGDAHWQAPAFPVAVVDTTGAGDAFDAGFLHGWLAGWPLAEALRFANGTGALAVARVGASEGPPSEAAVRAFMQASGEAGPIIASP